MPRIRTIKPELFKDEELAELPPLTRLLFIGLFTMADSEGRLENRPRLIKIEILPYDKVNVQKMLLDLHSSGLCTLYKELNREFIHINSFSKHQRITGKEADSPSQIPPPKETTGKQRGNNGETSETTGKEGKGRERKGKEMIYTEKQVFGPSNSKITKNPITENTPKTNKKADNLKSPYTLAVDHVMGTFLSKKGIKYPFTSESGRSLKRLLSLYDLNQVKALWDVFLNSNWDWRDRDGKPVHVAHDLRQFQVMIPRILDDSKWKSAVKKYEESNQHIQIKFNGMPPKENPQMRKLEALKGLANATTNNPEEN